MNKKILIADDHSVVRLGIKMVLETKFENIPIDYAKNYSETKEKLYIEKYDLIILDIEMEGSIYSSMIKELKIIHGDVKIMVFSNSDESIGVEYVKEGADGYLNKLSSDDLLVSAVQSIFNNGHFYPSLLIKHFANHTKKIYPKEVLSEREYEVFDLLIKGNGSLEISNILGIHVATAGTYKRRIYNKLGVTNVIDLFKLYKNL